MSINILGQKFLGTDEELISFIQKDLQNFINVDYQKYFTKKETAIEIATKVKAHLVKEKKDLEDLLKIYNSKDINLTEQQKIIEEKNSIFKCEKRLEILNNITLSKNYNEVLAALIEYYNLREYTTINDIKFLSSLQKILIFYFENCYYTSLLIDNEKEVIDFILSNKKFKDFSFDFNQTTEKKLSDKELKDILDKEYVWKNICVDLYISDSNSNNNSSAKKEVATSYSFNITSEENLKAFEKNINYTELHKLFLSTLKGELL